MSGDRRVDSGRLGGGHCFRARHPGLPHSLRSLAMTCVALCMVLSSCNWKMKPRFTYAPDKIASEMKKMCLHDYRLNVETRYKSDNLQAFFWRVGLLRSGQLEMQPEAAESLERVLLCATRISLSTGAPLQFLEVKMMDALTGATVTLWRFVPDIRDSMYTRMPEDEYVNRLVVEFDTSAEMPRRDWKEVHWDPPITMPEFLAKQVVLRVKRQSTLGLQAHEDVSQPATLVVVMDNWAAVEKQGAKQEDKLTDLMEQTVKTVVNGYGYTGFHSFVLKDPRGIALKSWTL